ncbi:MAG: Rieske 2Fe-2S domain-containing protein [Burkholderiaceae bacterium]|nr:Rieske 2Fe-2S domain-containing protein [Burkholderiaceae bacterium]
MRFDGQVVAYMNRCAHVPTEMDWQAGQFLDLDKRWILCSIHGAAYEPADGRCVGGPCGQGRLMAIRTEERGGEVYWYPSADIQPVAFDDAPPAATHSPPPESAP